MWLSQSSLNVCNVQIVLFLAVLKFDVFEDSVSKWTLILELLWSLGTHISQDLQFLMYAPFSNRTNSCVQCVYIYMYTYIHIHIYIYIYIYIQCATRVKPPPCEELRIGAVNWNSFVVIFSKIGHAIWNQVGIGEKRKLKIFLKSLRNWSQTCATFLENRLLEPS